MTVNSIRSILHISDFHFTRRRLKDQELVVQKLCEDIGNLCVGHRRPDLVVFTGDLVLAGGTDDHNEGYDYLISKISAKTHCSDDRIFIIPGNHDVERAQVELFSDNHEDWRTNSNDMEKLNEWYRTSNYDDVISKKFRAYHELENYLSANSLIYRNSFVSIYRLDALSVEIVVVNTAAFSTGGIEKFGNDQSNLGVPEHAIYDALKKLTEGSFKIFCTHHPLSFLAETSQKALRAEIQRNADVHLFGHMHEPVSANLSSFGGELFSNQAGAVFTSRKDPYIGYSLISVEIENLLFEANLRTYYDDRKCFDKALNVASDGIFYSSLQSRDFWRKTASQVDEQSLRTYISGEGYSKLLVEQQKQPGELEQEKRFVPAPMNKHNIRQGEDTTDDAKDVIPITIDDILLSDANLIIYAAPEFGRSTLLKCLRTRMMTDASEIARIRLPILFDFEDIKYSTEALLSLCKARTHGALEKVNIDSLLLQGLACVVIDDVDFGDAKKIPILRQFVERFPKCRYIFSSPKAVAAPYGAHVAPEMPIAFEFVEICEFKRRDMRQLVKTFENCENVEELLDRLQSEFKEISLPFTAANGTILMTILQEQSGFRPINRAVLVEQFIDTTLRKAAADQSKRETFDYGNKTALLAYIASWMVAKDDYVPIFEDLRECVAKYLKDVGLSEDIDKLFNEFFLARIIVRKPDNKACFRYRAILEYFIALRMSHDELFKAWILDESRYLQYINEIQYYAGKSRNDSTTLELVAVRFELELQKVFDGIGNEIDYVKIASLSLPVSKDSSAGELWNQLSMPPLTQEEKDRELEAEIPVDIEKRQTVFRPKIDLPGNRFILSVLLFSGLVKNLELVPDELKRRCLDRLWHGWSAFLHLSLAVVSELVRHRKLKINGVMYVINAPKSMPDNELARRIALSMPVSISKFASSSLGTEKLERQLTSPTLFDNTEVPLVFEFFRTALIADLRLSATPGAIESAFQKFRGSRYLTESLVWKVGELRRLERLRTEHFDAVTASSINAIAKLRGVSHEKMNAERSKQLNRIKKERLVLEIQKKFENE
jgi:3',5'-cyclic AMP phosphodiesterase CpdA